MRKYLLKIWKINQHIPDQSEYCIFLQHVKEFLRNNPNNAEFIRPLQRALNKIKNKFIIRLLYEIASEIQSDTGIVNNEIIKRHLNSSSSISGVFCYLTKFNIKSFNLKIFKKLLKGKFILEKNFFNFLNSNKDIAKNYLQLCDQNLLFNQLEIMVNCNVYYNLPYYVKFLGFDSKLICYKTYEMFNSFFNTLDSLDENSRVEFLEEYGLSGFIVTADGKFFIDLPLHSIKTCNFRNFVIHGLIFLKESTEILKSQDKIRIGLVRNYTTDDNVSEDFQLSASDIFKRADVHADESFLLDKNVNFNHVFRRDYRKDVCDCYEF